jgi:hypothetical protein
MKKILLAAVATVAFVSVASADYLDRESGVMVPQNVYGQSNRANTDVCGSPDYTMTDPDANIRLELQRDCASGGPDGGGTGD